MQRMPFLRISTISLLAASLGLAGCSNSFQAINNASPIATTGVPLSGGVHGGQQPVTGASIQLYAAGTKGYGSGSYALLNAAVTTTATGTFSITGDYICPSPSSQIYIVATGGNPGAATVNPSLSLMTALGPCSGLSSSTSISINELTTVASVYSLAPFITSYTAIGSSATNAQGLANAFASVNKVTNITTGGTPGPAHPAGAILPTSELNSIADILASCVNSVGGVAGDGSTCGTLFAKTTPPNAPAPTETIGALLNIALYPGRNVAALFGLINAQAPFQPTLTAANDFTVAIKYKTGGFSTPSASAIDQSGNLWVANAGNSTLTVLAPTGAPVTGPPYTGGGLSGPSGVAIDAVGNAWVTNKTASTLSAFTPAGAGTQSPLVGLSSPTSVAIDGQGLIWIANAGNNSVTEFTVSGTTAVSSANYPRAGINTPVAIAIDPK